MARKHTDSLCRTCWCSRMFVHIFPTAGGGEAHSHRLNCTQTYDRLQRSDREILLLISKGIGMIQTYILPLYYYASVENKLCVCMHCSSPRGRALLFRSSRSCFSSHTPFMWLIGQESNITSAHINQPTYPNSKVRDPGLEETSRTVRMWSVSTMMAWQVRTLLDWTRESKRYSCILKVSKPVAPSTISGMTQAVDRHVKYSQSHMVKVVSFECVYIIQIELICMVACADLQSQEFVPILLDMSRMMIR